MPGLKDRIMILVQMLKSETQSEHNTTEKNTNDAYIASFVKELDDPDLVSFVRFLFQYTMESGACVETAPASIAPAQKEPVCEHFETCAHTQTVHDETKDIDDLNTKEMIKLKTWVIKWAFIFVGVMAVLIAAISLYILTSGKDFSIVDTLVEMYKTVFLD